MSAGVVMQITYFNNITNINICYINLKLTG